MPDEDVLNMFNQLVLAGLDTVKSALSYAMLHLATSDADRRRIATEPSIIPNAIEELLPRLPPRDGGPQAQPGHRLPRRADPRR